MDKMSVNEFISDMDLQFVEPIFCSKCFTTLQDFLNDGFVGCPNCYKVFEKEVKNYINSTQASTNHIGKLYISKHSQEQALAELENELKIAIQEDCFEDCLTLKHKINSIKEKNNGQF